MVEFFNLEGRALQTKDLKWQINCEKIVYFVDLSKL